MNNSLKAMTYIAIENGSKKADFKKAVRKQLIKVSTNREHTALCIKEAKSRIDKYWKEILKEGLSL